MGERLKAIRTALRDALLNRTNAGDRVSTNRADPHWQDQLPAIVIYTGSESVERDQAAPPAYRRVARVIVEMAVEHSEVGPGPDDLVDDLAEQVEQVFFEDPELRKQLGDLVQSARQVGFDMLVAASGDALLAGARITLEFLYFQDAPTGDPGELWPWKSANVKISLDPSEPVN